MTTKSFRFADLKFEPQTAYVNGARVQIWTVWKLSKEQNAWIHDAKISTPNNSSKTNIFVKYSQVQP